MQKSITIVSRELLQFRRTTNRWGKKGTWSGNQGYLAVGRNAKGHFMTKRA